jgi:hypothetical protein
MKQLRVDMFQVSVAFSVLTALVILSFPSYFLYLPFQDGFSLFAFLGFTTLLGWIFLVIIPPLFFSSSAKWSTLKSALFVAGVSLYTLSTLGVKVASLLSIGVFYAEYLVLYPVLIFIEWLLPSFYIYVALRRTDAQV